MTQQFSNDTNEVWIDGDLLPYQIGFATQRTVYMVEAGGEFTAPLLVTTSKLKVNKLLKLGLDLSVSTSFLVETPMQAINTLKLRLNSIVKGSGCDIFKVVLSGPTNFREDIATIQPYKGNREGFEKPVHFDLLRDWLMDKPYTIMSDNEEADDVVSRAMIDGHLGASTDKDLNNTPGWHYNFQKGEIYHVSETEAYYNFYAQCLTGDKADNIPGIRGVGPKTAIKILGDCTDPDVLESKVLEYYSTKFDNPVERLNEVGKLLWMRRAEGEMWEVAVHE